MRIRSLQLTQFRSYSSLSLALGEGDLHVFTGANGSGKTNLIEAVAVLSLLRSAQGLEEEDLVAHGTDFYRVRGALTFDAGEEETLEVTSQLTPRRQKAAFRNDVRVPPSRLVGRLPAILFLPQDLELFAGPPAGRRRFLDILLSQVSPEYDRSLSEYQRLLKQRNALLRRIADREAKRADLATWDAALAEKGSTVTIARLELLETFSLALRDELHRLGEPWAEAEMVYDRRGTEREADALRDELVHLLAHAHDKDILLCQTSVGPHRDDWQVRVDGHQLPRVASRGQQRTAVLALLFLESCYLELRRGEKPVVLLDDVFSELDDAHQERVLESFPGHQVFLTTTHVPKTIHTATVWNVRKGAVTRTSSRAAPR